MFNSVGTKLFHPNSGPPDGFLSGGLGDELFVPPDGYISPTSIVFNYNSTFQDPDADNTIIYQNSNEVCILETPPFQVTVVACESGGEVFSTYKEKLKDAVKEPRRMWLIAEQVSKDNEYNLFGTFCLIALGDEFRNRLSNASTPNIIFSKSIINNTDHGAIMSLEDQAEYIQKLYSYRFNNAYIETETVLNAFKVELNFIKKNSLGVFAALFNIDEWVANICYFLAETIEEKAKFKPINYDYQPGKEYKPFLPIATIVDTLEKVEKDGFVEQYLSSISGLANSALGYLDRLLSIDSPALPPLLFTVFKNVKDFFENIATYVNSASKIVAAVAKEYLLLGNAFYCGLLNGLMSLIQAVLYLLGIVVDYFLGVELDQAFTGEAYKKIRNIAEHIEDIWQFIQVDIPKFAKTLYEFFENFDANQFNRVIEIIKIWFKDKSIYDAAYFMGNATFEVAAGVLLAIFTGGASLVAQGGKKVADLVKLIGKEFISFATFGLPELLSLLKGFFTKLANALKKGFANAVDEIITFLKKILGKEDKADDAFELQEVVIEVAADLRPNQIRLANGSIINAIEVSEAQLKTLFSKAQYRNRLRAIDDLMLLEHEGTFFIKYKGEVLLSNSKAIVSKVATDFLEDIETTAIKNLDQALEALKKPVILKLKGQDVELNGFNFLTFKYVKRLPQENKKLRDIFNSKTRKNFLSELAKDNEAISYLRNNGVTNEMIEKMKKKNRPPKGWNVHHIFPLDDSGTNDFQNLVLIQDNPKHRAITAYQKMLKIKDTKKTEWPVFSGKVYSSNHK